jgi:unconventional prefoldin RPB5 interactor 1
MGKKAFMPGKLMHTNEIMVLLGDGWFVQRSAKQAAEIVDRRLKGIEKISLCETRQFLFL